jgi:phage-related protein (TIGR01555 family)
MFNWLKRLFAKTKPIAQPEPNGKSILSLFSTNIVYNRDRRDRLTQELFSFKPPTADWTDTETGQDSFLTGVKPQLTFSTFEAGLPTAALMWFATQAFVGYQVCAVLAQHWLVDKACKMPGADAVRKGYELDIDIGADQDKPDTKMIKIIKKRDKHFQIKKQLEEYVHFGRMFGIRIAMFCVDSANPEEYYKNPFNPDAIKPGTYKGISQIDPYWIVPELNNAAVVDPSSQSFYEPTYWRVNGLSIHKSHLCIYRTGKVADILKPAYYYGGVSVPQRIAERIYAAERTANEAPLLALSKRSTVLNVELEAAITNPNKFAEKMDTWSQFRDNYGIKVVGTDEKISQFDTTLSDMDSLIMTQYQLVAAIAEVPGTKLLGTQPKGFNSTGEYEESSYHEFLETIQENDLSPVVDKHHVCLIASELQYQFPNIKGIDHMWNKLDAMTEEELAALNLLKSQTDEVLTAVGAIDGVDVRNRVRNDDQSGYNDLTPNAPIVPGASLTPEHGGSLPAPAGQPGQPTPQGGGDPGVASAAQKLTPGRPKTPSVPQMPGA